MPERASTMWSPAVLLRWMVPLTWPLASVTPWAGLSVASLPGSMTSCRSTGAPTTGLLKAVRVTVNGTDAPGSPWAAGVSSLSWTGPGGGAGLVNCTGPWAMIGPLALGRMSPVEVTWAPGVPGTAVVCPALPPLPAVDPPPVDELALLGASTLNGVLAAYDVPTGVRLIVVDPWAMAAGSETTTDLSPHTMMVASWPPAWTMPCWVPKLVPSISTTAPGAACAGVVAVMRGMTVKGGAGGGLVPLVVMVMPVPPGATPSGTANTMVEGDHCCTVAATPPMLTPLLDDCAPNPAPLTVTVSPTAACDGETLVTVALTPREPE